VECDRGRREEAGGKGAWLVTGEYEYEAGVLGLEASWIGDGTLACITGECIVEEPEDTDVVRLRRFDPCESWW
jgi:hypothetical protein